MSDKLKLEILFGAIDRITKPLKAIQSGSSETAKALKAAKDQLRELNAAQGNINAFRKVGKDLAITGNMLKASQEKIRSLKEEIAKLPAPTRDMSRAMKEATAEASDLKRRHNELIERQQRLRATLNGAGMDTHKLADHQRDLKKRIDDATGAVKLQGDALEVANKKMQRMHAARAQLDKSNALRDKIGGAGAKMGIAGAAVNAAAAIPVIAYAKAEDSATQLKVALMQKGGIIASDFGKINALAEKLGNKLPGTTSDFQDMMTTLVQQGMQAKTILGGLGEATAYLSVQLRMAPTDAALFASQLQDATRTTDKEMMGLMDTIQKTFNLGVKSDYMLQGFSKLSPALSIIHKEGLDAAKALAPLIAMANQNGMTDGGSAGNALRKIFQMSLDKKHVAKGNAELAGTGVKLDFTDGKGHFGGIDKLFAQLKKLKGVDDDQIKQAALKKIFGDDAETLQVLGMMIQKGASGYAEVQAKMEAQANIQERVNLQLKTLKNLWDAATGTFTNALVAFGESIAPELHAAAERMGALAEKVQLFAKNNPGFSHALMTTVKWLGLLLVALGGLAAGAYAVLGPLIMLKYGFALIGIKGAGVLSMLMSVGKGFLWLGRIMLMNPIGLAITAIALAAFLIYRYWEPIKGFFGGLWAEIRAAFDGGILGIGALILNWSPLGLFYKAFAAVMGWFGIELPGKFTEFGGAIIRGLANGILGALGWVKDAVVGVAGSTVGWFKEKLGIHSPSRVFAELGGYTMAGLEQGLLGGQDGPLAAVMATAKRLSAIGAGVMLGGAAMAGDIAIDTRPPINSGAMAQGAVFAPNYNITVNAAPGMDEQQLAQMVAREIERLDRQRAARSRSRLTDPE